MNNNNEVQISVILPVYNGEVFLDETIQSILKQSYKIHEIIIIDDGSTDSSYSIIEKYAGDVIVLRQTNSGQSAARNYGVSYATGNFLAFIDQDDIWYDNHLQILVNNIESTSQRPIGWIYSNLDQIDHTGKMIYFDVFRKIPHVAHPKTSLLDCIRTDMFVLPSSALVSRAAFDHVGGFDERLIGCEDDDLFLRIFISGFHNIYVPISTLKWRIHSSSSSHSTSMGKSRLIYVEKLVDLFKDQSIDDYNITKDIIGPRFNHLFVYDYFRGLENKNRSVMKISLERLNYISSITGNWTYYKLPSVRLLMSNIYLMNIMIYIYRLGKKSVFYRVLKKIYKKIT